MSMRLRMSSFRIAFALWTSTVLTLMSRRAASCASAQSRPGLSPRLLGLTPCTRRAMRVNGNSREDGRALTRRGLYLQRAPDVRGPLTHVQQPYLFTVRLRVRVRLEALAVVLDDEFDVIAAAFQQNVYAFGPGVLRDVIQRLLRDAVEVDLDLRLEALLVQTPGVKLGGGVEVFRPLLGEVGERRREAEFVERGGPQLPREEVQV